MQKQTSKTVSTGFYAQNHWTFKLKSIYYLHFYITKINVYYVMKIQRSKIPPPPQISMQQNVLEKLQNVQNFCIVQTENIIDI